MKKLLNISAAILTLTLLNACVSKESLTQLKANETVSVLKLDVVMDGNKEGGLRSQCFGYFKDETGSNLPRREDKDTGYYIIKSSVGKVYLTKIECIANKVLYNKVRAHNFDNLYFIAQPGQLNYAGNLDVEWSSERFKVGDLIGTGGGSITADEGKILIKLSSRPAEAENFAKRDYNINKPLNESLFVDHPLLVK